MIHVQWKLPRIDMVLNKSVKELAVTMVNFTINMPTASLIVGAQAFNKSLRSP